MEADYINVIEDDGSLSSSALHSKRYTAGGFLFDRRMGLGSVPDVENIAYMGFVALMKPQTYLAYAGAGLREATVDYILAEKPVLSTAFLDIRMEDDGKICRVVGHEGRARMTAISRTDPDAVVPVAIFLRDGSFSLRHRHLEPEMFEKLREGLWSQRSEIAPTTWVPGEPFIGLVYENADNQIINIDYADRSLAPSI
jgi:hypothetical protein